VTGASGQLGRRVLELLLEANAGPIIAATRTPEKLSDFADKGVTVRHGDFDDPASLATTFADVDRLLLISTDVLGQPGKRLQQHLNAVKAAEEAGVSHVIYTSITNATDTPVLFAPDHAGTEEALAQTALGWTILRNNLYMDFLIPPLNRAYEAGGYLKATADGKTAYVTREDCARAAAAVLNSSFTGQRILDISGPQSLSQAEVAAVASKVTNQPLNYVPIEHDALIDGMVGAGLPRPVAEIYASLDAAIAQGKFDVLTNTVQELSSQNPIALSELLATHKDALLQA
jgi:NAD(P)H dehydrogenase (quinone)